MARGASSNTISRPETQAPQSARPKAAAFDDFLDDLMGGPPPTTSRTAASKQIRGNGQAASAQKEPLSLAEQLGLVGGPDVEAESGGRSTRSPPPQTAASSSTDSTPKRKLPFSEPEALPASKKLKPTLAESRPRQEARDLTSTSEDGEGRSQKGGTASRAATPFRHTSALDESFVVPPSALPDLRRTQQPAESVATSRDKGKGRVDVVPVDIMDVDEQPQQGGTSRWTRTSPTSAAQSKVTAPASIPKRKTPFETPKVENEPRQRRRLNGTNGMDEGRGQKGPALITDPEELAGLRDLVQVEYFDVVAASVGASASVGGEVSISEPNFKRFRKNQPPSAVPTRIVPIAVYNADDIPVVGRNGGGWALKPNARKPADRKKSQRVELEADPDEEVEEDVEEDSENQDRVKSSARSQYSSRSQVASSSRESTPARNVGIGRSSFGGRAFVVRDEDDEEEGGWGQMLGK
ncbi:hypothetical protein HK097_007577 [Rhizophlyctis rosea]|uniref:Uncharacterized protein n=1 Tax=Rhizophlyctis rosea TaxID=64517 RepID=A0AAD5X6N5_9FUNG|nr:hypothetical protein HK097_007577 [Rhizophlyctis rosea]